MIYLLVYGFDKSRTFYFGYAVHLVAFIDSGFKPYEQVIFWFCSKFVYARMIQFYKVYL